MAAFFRSLIGKFIETPANVVVAHLSQALATQYAGDHANQIASWEKQVALLQLIFDRTSREDARTTGWAVLFEYPLVRLQRRLDVVILAGSRILVVEFKVGAKTYGAADVRQVEDYALDLRDFHTLSHNLCIVPILCATAAPAKQPKAPPTEIGVSATYLCNDDTLEEIILAVAKSSAREQIDIDAWDASPYRPVPTIIEAAELLYAGHSVSEIALASSAPENLGLTTDRLLAIIDSARQSRHRIVAFVTGVPGSGKTLAGLNAVHDPRFRIQKDASGAFLSGNTPLVTVLREALARDDNRRTKRGLGTARREVKAQIQGLMNYLREYISSNPDHTPPDQVVIFDEAQRAWDAEYGAQKFNRESSEPALFLEILGRHKDWAVIIALVGGGQEIGRGERGLSEWGAALVAHNAAHPERPWLAIGAPAAISGGDVTAWQSEVVPVV